MIVEELYDALIEAGASAEKAKAASRAVADMEGHFANIHNEIFGLKQEILGLKQEISELRSYVDRKISELRSHFDQQISELRSYVEQRFTQVEGTLRLHNWMLGTILAFLVAVFFKVFSH